MARPQARTALALAGALLAGTLALASCANDSPTEPAPKVTVHRTVTAVVSDSLGDPVANVSLFWAGQFASGGAVSLDGTTDDHGENQQVLEQGGWIVTTSPGAQAGGASLVVAGAERAAADTQVVRVTMHTASRIRGVVTLAGRTDHRGTIVVGDTGGLAVTDSTGAWAMDGAPLGRWTILMTQFGFKTAIHFADVVTPGSVVVVPTVALVSDP